MKRIREGGRQPLSDDGAGSDLVSRGERNRYFIGFGMKKQTFLNLEEKRGGCFSRAIISCMHSFLQQRHILLQSVAIKTLSLIIITVRTLIQIKKDS